LNVHSSRRSTTRGPRSKPGASTTLRADQQLARAPDTERVRRPTSGRMGRKRSGIL
jgi:hypothetical protein